MLNKLLLIVFFFYASAAHPADLKDLTILVSSCDKYSELWPVFFKQLFKNWPSLTAENQNIRIVLLSNANTYDNTRVVMVNSPKELNWSGNMLDALSKIDTKYVLYLQDDYFFDKAVDEERFAEVLGALQARKAAYVELLKENVNNAERNSHLEGSLIKPKDAQYRNSLQAAIWEKDVLEWLLVENETPWQFEVKGGERAKGVMREFWVMDSNLPLTYINVVEKGFVTDAARLRLKEEGIDFAPKVLPYSSDHKLMWYLAINKPKQFKVIAPLYDRFIGFAAE